MITIIVRVLISGIPDSNLLGSGVESIPNRTFNSTAWNTEQADRFHAGMYFLAYVSSAGVEREEKTNKG